MQTVNFSCGHCGNLMAVTLDLLGQQVRCPHCQQVVLAPASADSAPGSAGALPGRPEASAAPPPEPEPFSFPSSAGHDEESIFTPKPVHDDLFADTKPATLEVPPEASWANAPAPPPEVAPPPEPPPELAFHPPGGNGLEFDGTANHTAEVLPHSPPANDFAPQEDSATRLAVEAAPEPAVRPVGRKAKQGPSVAVIALIFLIPYALIATAFAISFAWKLSQAPQHPLEYLPDWPSEHPGASRKAPDKVSSVYQRVSPETPLPAHLRVGLHKALRVGNLQVTPEKVEQKPILFCSDIKRRKADYSRGSALVLTLRLQNLSSDEWFYPTDPAFEAKWTPGKPKPYTFLEIGSKKFFGGPTEWEPTAKGGPTHAVREEFIQGQEEDNRPLGPGGQRVTVVCTDPDNPEVGKALQNYRGPLLWRVRLRRGLERYKDREVCVSAVVGVEFAANDIQKARP